MNRLCHGDAPGRVVQVTPLFHSNQVRNLRRQKDAVLLRAVMPAGIASPAVIRSSSDIVRVRRLGSSASHGISNCRAKPRILSSTLAGSPNWAARWSIDAPSRSPGLFPCAPEMTMPSGNTRVWQVLHPIEPSSTSPPPDDPSCERNGTVTRNRHTRVFVKLGIAHLRCAEEHRAVGCWCVKDKRADIDRILAGLQLRG